MFKIFDCESSSGKLLSYFVLNKIDTYIDNTVVSAKVLRNYDDYTTFPINLLRDLLLKGSLLIYGINIITINTSASVIRVVVAEDSATVTVRSK